MKELKYRQVAKLYNEDKTIEEISQDLHITINTVNTYISLARKEGLIEDKEKKTRIEQVAELYNLGEEKQEITQKIKIKENTAESYISKAIKKGLIKKQRAKQKTKTRIEQVAELYNAKKTKEEIEEELRIKEHTLGSYIAKARKKGLIKRPVERKKSKVKDVARLYKLKKTRQEIASELNLTEKTVGTYLNKARREGLIEVKRKEKTRLEEVAELYNLEKSKQEIAHELHIKEHTVESYIGEARKKGLIKNKKTKKKLEQVTRLYYLGKSKQEIAHELHITEHTLSDYMSKARRAGLIEKKKNRVNQIADLYNDEISIESIAKRLKLKELTVERYLKKAKRIGLLKIIQPKKVKAKSKVEKAVSKQSKKTQKDTTNLKDNPSEKISQIIELCVKHYPRDVGKMLGLKPVKVYDAIDSLDDLQSKKLLKRRLMNNPLYDKVKGLMKSKGMKANQALYEMVKTEKGYLNRINLAKMYYLLGNDKIPQRLLNEILSDGTVSFKIRQMAGEEKEKIMLEITSSKIREEYKNGRNMDGSKISYDDLCKRHNVRVGFILDVLGQEEMNIER